MLPVLTLIMLGQLLPPIEFTPLIHVEDSDEDEITITEPFDALYHQGVLYVADINNYLLIFDGDKPVIQRGFKGKGPGGFNAVPEYLEVVGDELVVTENFRWSRSFYTLDGTYLRKEKMTRKRGMRRPVHRAGKSFRKIRTDKQAAAGVLFREEAGGGGVGICRGKTPKEVHLETAELHEWREDHILVVKMRGAFEIYDAKLKLIKEFAVPLNRFAVDLEKHIMSDLIAKMEQIKFEYYVNGTPIYRAQVVGDTLWLLVHNELLQNEVQRPTDSYIFKVDLPSGKVRYKASIGAVTGFQVHQGAIIFSGMLEGFATAYAVKDFP